MSDQKTVIAADNANEGKVLVMEDLLNQNPEYNPLEFGQHKGKIQSLVLMEQLNVVIVGDDTKNLVQYRQSTCGGAWTMQKNYSNLGIGKIRSSTQIGHWAFFGGDNYTIRAVDVKSQEIIGMPQKTAIKTIFGLEVFSCSESQHYLSVSGESPSYTETQTDIFDVSGLVEPHKPRIPFSQAKNETRNEKSFEYNSTEKPETCCMCNCETFRSQMTTNLRNHFHHSLEEAIEKLKSAFLKFGKMSIFFENITL